MSSLPPAPSAAIPKPSGKVRWIVVALLFGAVVLSYIDRLVLPTLKPELQGRYGWSETGYADLAIWFQGAYGISYVVFGRLIDRFGARIGYALAVGIWTAGHVAHVFFTSTGGMILARIPLAIGEAGTFPAAIAATNEWFPRRERAFAIGVFNAGSNIGAILTPLIVPIIAVTMGWRMAFILTGMLTVLWLVVWLAFYRRPQEHKRVSAEELAFIESDPVEPTRAVAWSKLLRRRQTWAYMTGRFLIDPVWWTFLFWLPDFFNRQYGITMLAFGPPLIAIYLLADVGSVAGGWFSSRLIGNGVSINRARKTAMFACALCAVPIAFATQVPSMWWAVLLIGLACAGHQGFSANLYALPGDLLPRWAAGSVVGLGGLSGAIGGMLMARYAGNILETVGSYQPIFAVAACAYLLALLVIHLIVPRYTPADPKKLA
ncbi:MFS transporter [Sphingomonas japonica]|uniref:ACS family hexuronate transporter-like MFS transporter n=1 Tax=Sphingomonas japonica TaxID=511662 RepID=A0ABX0U2P4_9SPHN|nr:ACS family hexuronate transporter-like MFS transporter [Sphingomonas japonica]